MRFIETLINKLDYFIDPVPYELLGGFNKRREQFIDFCSRCKEYLVNIQPLTIIDSIQINEDESFI